MDTALVNQTGGVLVTPPPNLLSHLDWIEITYPILGKRPMVEYPSHWSTERVECKPKNGYKIAVRYADGREEMVHPDQPNMGIHITLPAQTLQNLKEDDKWLLNYFIGSGGKITRLDCALDAFGKKLNFDQLWLLVREGNYKCRLRKPPLRECDAKTGDTIYFGRMKASVCTRIYNKAAEQGVSGDWIRVETMFRHGRANNAAKMMVKQNLDCQSFVSGHVQIPDLEWWVDTMTKKPVKTRLDRSTQSKRYEWLMKSVAPTLAKEIHLHGNEVYDEFRARVLDELNKLKQSDDHLR